MIIRKNTTSELIALMEYKAKNIKAEYSSDTFLEVVLALKALEEYEAKEDERVQRVLNYIHGKNGD